MEAGGGGEKEEGGGERGLWGEGVGEVRVRQCGGRGV